jgi:hypothetical protein
MVVLAAIISTLCHQPRNTSSPSPPAGSASPAPPSSFLAAPPSKAPRRERVGKADGVVPDGVTVFDDRVPAVANLDPELLRALRQAATDAADDGATSYVNSGWRSAEYQNRKAIDRGCPQMYADPAQDPRMQQ